MTSGAASELDLPSTLAKVSVRSPVSDRDPARLAEERLETIVTTTASTPSPSRSSFRRKLRRGLLFVLALLIGGSLFQFERFFFRNNFGEVEAGRVYRSAQPRDELARTIADYQIASVLNLRGGSRKNSWYANEVDTTRNLSVDFYDFPMQADEPPSRDQILQLLDFFDRCDYPLLIHCKSGSDRTGLAVALYRMVVDADPPEQAEQAFSLDYAHIPLFGPERLHDPLRQYAAWLRLTSQPHEPARFRDWVSSHYQPSSANILPAKVEPIRPGPRAELSRGTTSLLPAR